MYQCQCDSSRSEIFIGILTVFIVTWYKNIAFPQSRNYRDWNHWSRDSRIGKKPLNPSCIMIILHGTNTIHMPVECRLLQSALLRGFAMIIIFSSGSYRLRDIKKLKVNADHMAAYFSSQIAGVWISQTELLPQMIKTLSTPSQINE